VTLRHLGIIPDGNRRWAKAHGLDSLAGHKEGVKTLKNICYQALENGVEIVTYYAFSTENWKRTPKEVKYLMELFIENLSKDISEVHEKNIKFKMIGRRDGLSDRLINAILKAESLTSNNSGGTLVIAINYGGEQEIADALVKLYGRDLDKSEITPDLIADNLYCPEIPSVDLLIRTSGEKRISGFMLWRAAYAELYFVEKYWPDFSRSDLIEAIDDYNKRKRRFGE
jgi:undecaprenyl diphosphate synthase